MKKAGTEFLLLPLLPCLPTSTSRWSLSLSLFFQGFLTCHVCMHAAFGCFLFPPAPLLLLFLGGANNARTYIHQKGGGGGRENLKSQASSPSSLLAIFFATARQAAVCGCQSLFFLAYVDASNTFVFRRKLRTQFFFLHLTIPPKNKPLYLLLSPFSSSLSFPPTLICRHIFLSYSPLPPLPDDEEQDGMLASTLCVSLLLPPPVWYVPVHEKKEGKEGKEEGILVLRTRRGGGRNRV